MCKRFGFQYFLFISKTVSTTPLQLLIIQGSSESNDERIEREGLLRISKREGFGNSQIDVLLANFPSDVKRQLTNILLSSNIDVPLVNSVCFPVYEKNDSLAALVLTSTVDHQRCRLTVAQYSQAQELVKNIHQTANGLITKNNTTLIKLTKREIECLNWAALGKTNEEIGIILGVSKRTIVFHLQNSAEKLGTSNRYHTVARAISMGLIKDLI